MYKHVWIIIIIFIVCKFITIIIIIFFNLLWFAE